MDRKLPVRRNDGGLGELVTLKGTSGQPKSRQLHEDCKGGLKYFVKSKILKLLKTEYLEGREIRPTLNQLLKRVYELHVSDDMKMVKLWLGDALKNDPQIRLVLEFCNNKLEARYAYLPPLKTCTSERTLFNTLKEKYENGQAGLLQDLVEDSVPMADCVIANLLRQDKIVQEIGSNNIRVLFYKPPEPKENFAADNCFLHDLLTAQAREKEEEKLGKIGPAKKSKRARTYKT